jgi:hypothetical protein
VKNWTFLWSAICSDEPQKILWLKLLLFHENEKNLYNKLKKF